MFDQFLNHISGKEGYLLFSLWVFLAFFIIVTVLLMRMRKQHVNYMRGIPLDDCTISTSKSSEP